jgi:hypothetical protein
MKKAGIAILLFIVLFLCHWGVTYIWPRMGASFLGSAFWALIMAVAFTWIFFRNKEIGEGRK